jgi:nonribosomal peptide synthetase DhbF
VSSLVVLSNQWTEPDEQHLPVEIETLGRFKSMRFAAGYAQSKAVADLMAHEARARGIPVSVYRVGMVGGGARIGGWAQTDMVARMFKSWIELGHAYPSVVVMTPADEVAQFIVDRALAGDGPGRTWHVDTPHRYRMSEIAELLRALGFEVQVVPYASYRSVLRAHLKSPPIAGLFEILPEQWDDVFYEVFCQMSCSQTQEAMRRAGAALHPLDEALLDRYIRAFRRAGFLRK